MHILAVDDEPVFCELLRQQLTELGERDVDIVHSGIDALQHIKQSSRPIECFLLDVRMMPMDGIELARRIRAIPKHQTTPIIMISALTDKQSIDQAFIAGANDYITKPLDAVELKIRLSMARLILTERAQSRLLQARLSETEESEFARLRFDSDVLLSGVDGAISVSSLENYLLKQGTMRLRRSCAFGIRMSSAEAWFRTLDPVYFVDLLTDIGCCISRSLRTAPHLITYAGSGDFVVVLPDRVMVDSADIQGRIDAELSRLAEQYDGMGMTLPGIRVGQPARVNIWPLDCPTNLISKARSAAFSPSFVRGVDVA